MPAGEGVYVPVILPVISVIPIISEPCPGEDFVLIMYLEINECNLLAVARAHHAHTLVSGVREVAVGVGRGQDVVLEARGDLHPPQKSAHTSLLHSVPARNGTHPPEGPAHTAHCTFSPPLHPARYRTGRLLETSHTVTPQAGTRMCSSEFIIHLDGSPFKLNDMNQLLLSTLSACPGDPSAEALS